MLIRIYILYHRLLSMITEIVEGILRNYREDYNIRSYVKAILYAIPYARHGVTTTL